MMRLRRLKLCLVDSDLELVTGKNVCSSCVHLIFWFFEFLICYSRERKYFGVC